MPLPPSTPDSLDQLFISSNSPPPQIRGYQNQGRWILSEVQVAKESDFGRNDKVYFAKTHLGHLLNPGAGGGG